MCPMHQVWPTVLLTAFPALATYGHRSERERRRTPGYPNAYSVDPAFREAVTRDRQQGVDMSRWAVIVSASGRAKTRGRLIG
jgi:hypothetical protein